MTAWSADSSVTGWVTRGNLAEKPLYRYDDLTTGRLTPGMQFRLMPSRKSLWRCSCTVQAQSCYLARTPASNPCLS